MLRLKSSCKLLESEDRRDGAIFIDYSAIGRKVMPLDFYCPYKICTSKTVFCDVTCDECEVYFRDKENIEKR